MTVESDPLALAQSLGMEVMNSLADHPLMPDIEKRLPYTFVKKNSVLPIHESDGQVTVATSEPLNINAFDELRLIFEKEIHSIFVPHEELLGAINLCYHQKEGSTSRFIEDLSQEAKEQTGDRLSEDYDLLETVEGEAPIIKLLNLILSEAIGQGASDIHFEPFENDLRVRYRIDGVLQPRHFPAPEYQNQLLTRIKVLARLDIAEHRLPQDGRIKLTMGGREIDLRVSTVPVAHGERIVLRILDKANAIELDQIGMLPSVLDQFRKMIALPEGIVLVTGPTGSGKTTTLYSALTDTYNEEKNIMTIEDPVEYKLKGIGQIAVHPKIGLNFATGLRHILRQDPDLVMIGEIRDQETAEIAIQAALTGHMVFSTLHTNDAASAIPRLIDMGIEPYLLSSSIVAVLAQRLVRKVCRFCRDRYIPTDKELQQLGLSREKLNGGVLYKGNGCAKCHNSGYKGRHGIYELLTVDTAMQSAIAKGATAAQLREVAKQKGMLFLVEHGAHLVRAGVTTTSEVLRVSRRN
ncbi:MAG: Type II secretion system protein E [Chlamydiales bacterium]|nr:Type II secretion system protein E [Chlamydiales bacterium]MCH9636286.1 Type II secretion system protein E [Chlamydiales bacterium]